VSAASTVIVERTESNRVAVVELHRPAARNAINAELGAAFVAALRELADPVSGVRAVVVTGADPAFCAGLDLRNLGAGTLGEVPKCAAGVRTCPLPVIGAINGAAVTAGLEVALSCDVLIASERARFADTHLAVRVYPGPVLVDLPRRVGPGWARRMSLSGEFVDAATAARIGLVEQVVPHEDLRPTAVALAERIAGYDPEMIAAMRAEWSELEARPREHAHAAHIESAGRLGFRGTGAGHLQATGGELLAASREQRPHDP
jgi:enoyl-CoA hydratase